MGYLFRAGLCALGSIVALAPTVNALDQQEHWEQTLQRAYYRSVQDASVIEASEIAPLMPMVPGNEKLIWREIDGELHILLTTWTGWDGYDELIGQNTTLSRAIWTTPAPQVKTFIQTVKPSADILPLRLEQYLGLPPSNGKTKWVELWVKPTDIFRPCPDTEITDASCSLYFSEDATREHKQWFGQLYRSSYGDNGYPWTRLGYTYDWGALDTEVGANELVVKAGAEVLIETVQSNEEYFGYPMD